MKRKKAMSKATDKTHPRVGVIDRNLADVETMRQETLIQLLFSRRFSGALWLGGSHKSEAIAIELNRHVWNLTRTFPGNLKRVCFEELVNLWNLIHYARVLKLLAEKLIWNVLPEQTNACRRGRILSRYNIEPNCNYISDMASESGPRSLVEDAQDEWAHLNSLSQQVKQIQNESPASITGKALSIMAEVDAMLSCIEAWERGLKRCRDLLKEILDAPSTGTDAIKRNPTLEDMFQLIQLVRDDQEKDRFDREVLGGEMLTTARRGAFNAEEAARAARNAEAAAKRLNKAAALDADLVETFRELDEALQKKKPGHSEAAIAWEVLEEAQKKGRTMGNYKAREAGAKSKEPKFLAYYRGWVKLGRPDAEDYHAEHLKNGRRPT